MQEVSAVGCCAAMPADERGDRQSWRRLAGQLAWLSRGPATSPRTPRMPHLPGLCVALCWESNAAARIYRCHMASRSTCISWRRLCLPSVLQQSSFCNGCLDSQMKGPPRAGACACAGWGRRRARARARGAAGVSERGHACACLQLSAARRRQANRADSPCAADPRTAAARPRRYLVRRG